MLDCEEEDKDRQLEWRSTGSFELSELSSVKLEEQGEMVDDGKRTMVPGFPKTSSISNEGMCGSTLYINIPAFPR